MIKISDREIIALLRWFSEHPGTGVVHGISRCFASQMRGRSVKNRAACLGLIEIIHDDSKKQKRAKVTELGKEFLAQHACLPSKPVKSYKMPACISYRVDPDLLSRGVPIELLPKQDLQILESTNG